jgi:hypothetical protein
LVSSLYLLGLLLLFLLLVLLFCLPLRAPHLALRPLPAMQPTSGCQQQGP